MIPLTGNSIGRTQLKTVLLIILKMCDQAEKLTDENR